MGHIQLLDVLSAVAAVPMLAASGYLATLAILSRRSPAKPGRRDTRFDVIVPAHNEAHGIAATVESLLGVDYPRDQFRVIVVADNCTDDTACRARAAGAEVIERTDPVRRGKGHALSVGYVHCLATGVADAIVVVDADSVVTRNILSAFAARFACGAEAVQAEYGVRNPSATWRTRLMTLAFTLFHNVRSLARERLRVSCGLRGNGMGFSVALLRRVPPDAYSIVEDIEYGIAIGLAGTRVIYVEEAVVRGEMPEGADASRTQRERWERGRADLARLHVPTLLRAWGRGAGRVPFDLAADLVMPPVTSLAMLVMAGCSLNLWAYARGIESLAGLIPWLVAFSALAVYVGRGVILSGIGARAWLDLAWVPVYVAWKVSVRLRPSASVATWVRTPRAHEVLILPVIERE